jgi:hypothetical protein
MIAVVSVFLPWTRDGGHLSSFGNESHKTALTGETFSGLEGAGGSWFGIVTLAIGVFIVTRCLVARLRHGAAFRVVTAGGVLVAGIAMTFMTSAHLLARWPDGSTGHTALGGVAAVGGSLLALVGAASWVRAVPEATVRQRRRPSAVGPRVRVIVGVLLLVASGFAAWSADVRVTTVVSAETHAEIDRLTRESQEKPELAAAYSGEISAILAQVRANGLVSVDGFDGDGPGLGWWTLVAGMSALAIALGTSRLHQRADRQRMMWTSVMAGLGAAAALIPLAWIATAMRSGDDGYVSGVGAALAVFGGWLIVGAWRVITEDHGMPTARDPRGYSLISGSGSSTTTAVSVGRRDA